MEKGRDLASCSLGIYFDHVTYMFFLSNFSEKKLFSISRRYESPFGAGFSSYPIYCPRKVIALSCFSREDL